MRGGARLERRAVARAVAAARRAVLARLAEAGAQAVIARTGRAARVTRGARDARGARAASPVAPRRAGAARRRADVRRRVASLVGRTVRRGVVTARSRRVACVARGAVHAARAERPGGAAHDLARAGLTRARGRGRATPGGARVGRVAGERADPAGAALRSGPAVAHRRAAALAARAHRLAGVPLPARCAAAACSAVVAALGGRRPADAGARRAAPPAARLGDGIALRRAEERRDVARRPGGAVGDRLATAERLVPGGDALSAAGAGDAAHAGRHGARHATRCAGISLGARARVAAAAVAPEVPCARRGARVEGGVARLPDEALRGHRAAGSAVPRVRCVRRDCRVPRVSRVSCVPALAGVLRRRLGAVRLRSVRGLVRAVGLRPVDGRIGGGVGQVLLQPVHVEPARGRDESQSAGPRDEGKQPSHTLQGTGPCKVLLAQEGQSHLSSRARWLRDRPP